MLNFFSRKEHSNLIYVLDFLLQIAINGEEINKVRKIDLGLYKLLNRTDVNQEVFHMGILPITRKNQKPSKEFIGFINKLSLYIEYDLMSDFVWSQVAENENKQNKIQNSVTNYRKEILSYLFNNAFISPGDFESVTSNPIKSLAE